MSPRRKPRHYWWVEKSRLVPGFYRVKATGQLIPASVVQAWDTRELKRLHRMDRQRAKKEIRDESD